MGHTATASVIEARTRCDRAATHRCLIRRVRSPAGCLQKAANIVWVEQGQGVARKRRCPICQSPFLSLWAARSQSQNIHHIISTRAFVLAPKCGFYRTSGKDRAVGGHMAQSDAFSGSGKQHIMFTYNITAANR